MTSPVPPAAPRPSTLQRAALAQHSRLAIGVGGISGGLVLLGANITYLVVSAATTIPWTPLLANAALIFGGVMFLRERRRHATALLLLVMLASACARESREPQRPTATPASVAPEQFATLAWLSGRWRGSDSSGMAFYEAYAVIGPSEIRSYTYADSTFAQVTDSGSIILSGDTVFTGSPSQRWVATELDSTGVRFAPWRGASNSFAWRRGAEGSWTATLQWDSAGVAMSRTYSMRAVPAPAP